VTRLMRGLATLLQGNLEPLTVRDKVGRPLDELGVNKCVECSTFSLQWFDAVGWITRRASSV